MSKFITFVDYSQHIFSYLYYNQLQAGNWNKNLYNKFQIIGLNVKKYRKIKRLSQIDLAVGIGIDRSYLSEIENGRTNFSIGILFALADFFEINVADLLDEDITENQ